MIRVQHVLLHAARAVVAVALMMLASAPARADDDAEDVAEDIFRYVEEACPVGGSAPPYNLAEIALRYFVPGLKDELSRAYKLRLLDFDILIDAQDCEIPDIDVDDVGSDDGSRVTVRAEFENFGEKRVIDLLMVRIEGTWKVADIAYRHRDWSLRRQLAYAGGK